MNKQNNWKERFEKEFLHYISHGFPRDIVLENMQVFIEKEIDLAKEEERKKIAQFIVPKLQKFVDKVESGRARSKETYADMKEILQILKENKDETR